jgi:hypothetical protein
MREFFIAGGWMMFVVLATAIPMLFTAVKFARNATPHGLSLVRALTTAVVFASIAGVITNLASVGRNVASNPEFMKDALANILWGFNESMAPAILGFPLITITWILVAFGVRRMPHD